MTDKYSMTKEENIYLAKSKMSDIINRSINLKNLEVSTLDLTIILKDITLSEYPIETQNIILNLRNAWNYILNNITLPTDIEFCSKLNKEICLNDSQSITKKTIFKLKKEKTSPNLKNLEILEIKLDEILNQEISITEKAFDLMLWIIKNKIFKTGNTRTAFLLANKLLIENGKGFLSIPKELQEEYKQLLEEYYETNNAINIKNFLYNHCLEGLEK